jgi:transcription elongation factor Elf1
MGSNIKIDPSEPYRYQCPRCGSVSVHRLVGAEKIKGKQYPFDGRGKWEARDDRQKRARCKSCESRLERVIDKKTGDATKP